MPYRELQVVTLTEAGATPLVEVFLQLLGDVAGDLVSGWGGRPTSRRTS